MTTRVPVSPLRIVTDKISPGGLEGDENLDERSQAYQLTVRDLLDTQRRELVRLRDTGDISDEVVHTLRRELDLEDQRLEI